MASEVSGLPNGNYAPHAPYGDQNNYAYANNTHVSQPTQQQATPSTSTPSNAQATQQDIPKDEVGWYFVEQYYTTLSRSPDKLYLFYNKRSQFVSGLETDKVAVCVGQRAINDKIKDLDFHDCKVRVTNVDSQSSDANIVIQVIGELSNRSQPHRKFTQTFVLATQTNGYFVLNDIFRYLVEEEDEAEAEPQQEEVQQVPGTESNVQAEVPSEAPQNMTSSTDPIAIESDAKQVDKEIEEKLVNGKIEEDPVAATEEAASLEEQKSAEEDPAAQSEPAAAELERVETAQADTEAEKPKDPEPTPVPTPKEAPQEPAPASKPAAPAIPKTWASLAASANRVATPAAPQAAAPAAKPAAAKAAPSAPTAPAASQAPAAAPVAPAAPVQREDAKSSASQDEWTAVGGSHNRQQSRQVNSAQPQEQVQNRGYIKNVHENIDANKLRAELEKFGELQYFDVARTKNCAFVDFKTSEAYNKAVNAPFKIDDAELYVEERRIRSGSTPYVPRGQYQGGRGGARGGAGQGAPRGNFQGNRGNVRGGGRNGVAANGQRGGRGGAQS